MAVVELEEEANKLDDEDIKNSIKAFTKGKRSSMIGPIGKRLDELHWVTSGGTILEYHHILINGSGFFGTFSGVLRYSSP